MTAFSLPQDRAAVQDTHIHHLRHQIESRLKVGPRTQRLATLKPILVQVSLGEDLAASLTDGVVLCHIANHCSPRSVSSIHVPSPAVVSLLLFLRFLTFFSQPKLSAAKCRRNVDNFLAACRKIGVREVSDQFEQKQLLQLIFTFRLSSGGKQSCGEAHLGNWQTHFVSPRPL